jgi:hypothetical protein
MAEEHRCKTCGRKLESLLLTPKKLTKLQERMTELQARLETKGPEHKKAEKWNRRIAKIQRRLRGHTLAADVIGVP